MNSIFRPLSSIGYAKCSVFLSTQRCFHDHIYSRCKKLAIFLIWAVSTQATPSTNGLKLYHPKKMY